MPSCPLTFHLQDPMRAAHTACMEEPSLEFLAFALKTTTVHSANTLIDITPVRHVEATSVRMVDNVTTTVAPACVHPTMQALTVQS